MATALSQVFFFQNDFSYLFFSYVKIQSKSPLSFKYTTPCVSGNLVHVTELLK